MNKTVSGLLVLAGIVLIVFGLNSTDSIGSSFSRFFTGSPSEKSIWLIVVGVVVAAIGAFVGGRGRLT